ncbi:hypothetical protein PR202_gb12578 [Eleusine coracana subsp. coracana]|uniref:Uncharacterized protein n=1 Tax=Eleusine coracana subsp. coracana TaxID=191504 RepID=A0AAV5EPQ5_ELECO|nr:hypothetical protein PR202_gb12578 [Eleusine coracana subsp. coracana]
MMRSPPHADQSPSMKLSKPESVTLLALGSSLPSLLPPACLLLAASAASGFFVFARCPVRSREQSMSSTTMTDLARVSMNSLRRSVLLCTEVSSTS